MQVETVKVEGFRFSVSRNSNEVGRAYLYLLKNDLHARPFGLLEDVYVDDKYRSEGVASELLAEVLKYARDSECYKLIATSRNDGTRESVHAWYTRLGFIKYGTEFRLNF